MRSISQLALPTLVLVLFSCNSERKRYDKDNVNDEVFNTDAVDKVLDQFETIKFEDLPESYKTYSDPFGDFTTQMNGREYLIIKGEDVLQHLAGNNRIEDFLPGDEYKHKNEADFSKNKKQYWLTDRKMIYMIIEFMDKLEEQGYNKYGFYVRESHRHPKLNKARGGASKSQHLFGKAADLVIEDINNDGKKNQADKTIALEILEEIVGNKGGMGLYPGTMTIHIDCRGYRARWDTY
ncbi:MAG: hypothetical protein ACI857_000732 [Arenicella sp.]|jgi:uncharacterized protein YcbK (DUF882 family)